NAPAPFHEQAIPAAEAAQGVFATKGSQAFWRFRDAAYQNQNGLTTEHFVTWATEAGGTDSGTYRGALMAHAWRAKVEEDTEAAKAAGVNGTPTFFINGVNVSGAQPLEAFKAVIDRELGKAKNKLAAGTPRNQIYVTMARENQQGATAPAPDPGTAGPPP